MIRSALALAALVSAVIAAPAMAQEAPETMSHVIDLHHVDLTNDADWARINGQVKVEAHRVCERVVVQSDRYLEDIDNCVASALDNAHQQMRAVLAQQEEDKKIRYADTRTLPRG